MYQEKVNKCVGSLIKVKPEFEEQYIILHKYVFPGVLDRIRISNIRNYSIFLLNGILFSHYEYVGSDYDTDIKAIADPTTRDWWKLTDPMQEPLPTRKKGEWWAAMKQLLYIDKIISPSGKAQRGGLVAEIIPGKEDAIIKLFTNFPDEVKDIAIKEMFQNNNVYIKDNKIYLYYEYVGSDLWSSFHHLIQNKKFQEFQTDLNNGLLSKENGYWELMKEVFHTD